MEQSGVLSAIFNSIFPFSDFLYILQQEEYDSARYIKWLKRFFFRRNFQKRDHLKYTSRAKVILSATIFLWLVALISIVLQSPVSILVVLAEIILLIIAIPLFVLFGNLVLIPLSSVLRHRAMSRAAVKVELRKNMKIIAVAGSFGKTTTKNFIYSLIRYNYRTQLIPENINTTIGIAEWVNRNLAQNTDVLIVEMDAYKKGEIRESCEITPPDIAIITTIGDQHMERFSTVENLSSALGEVFVYAKPAAQLLCNVETEKMLSPVDGRHFTTVGPTDLDLIAAHPEIIARFSSSNRENLAFAIKVAKILNISDAFIIDTCGKMELPDRRQKMIVFHGYDCIDDSYNISFTTAQAGIAFARGMADVKKKNLLVVAAGIPELGPQDRDKNNTLGKILAENADHIAVLKSIFHKEIANEISDPQKFTLFKSLQEFIQKSKDQFPPEDWLILLQPELTDLYY